MPRSSDENLQVERVASDATGWQSALIDLSFEPIFAWDWNDGIVEWNAGAERQYGFKRSEALGKNSHELPAALDDLGLRDALSAFVDEWSRHHEIAADFHAAGILDRRFDRETETHRYRITQEALNNAAKYADAKHITVLLEKRGENLMLIIEDDGKGFDASAKTRSRRIGERPRTSGNEGTRVPH